MTFVEAHAPGRVNLIGEHTDYTDGLAMPMAIDLGTTVYGQRGDGTSVVLRSAIEEAPVEIPLDLEDPTSLAGWARYVGGVVVELTPTHGFDGHVTTTLPVGGGLSSSAALVVALALALGADGSDPVALARQCQQAEQRAGIRCGILDQLAVAAGVEDHALLLDFRSLAVEPVAIPDDVDVIILDSGEERQLMGSAYDDRRAQCEAAASEIGPLRDADLADVDRLGDDLLRRRARHVITENRRVRDFAAALRAGDYVTAGQQLWASHESLRDDFEVSTRTLDHLVEALRETPGVFGARLTGAGFGGCVVAITERGAVPWTTPVRASRGAHLVSPTS
ncbi:MAG TPA: galactokinase [Acidimicrobiales bacterium]|nr:galactokinase [Acidimicrobiales bacterium]